MPSLSERLARMEVLVRRFEREPDASIVRELRGLVAAEYEWDGAFELEPNDLLRMARVAVHAERFEQTMLGVLEHLESCPHVAASA